KPLAVTLARAGWKIAVIEREHVGGTCINVGCTPTKTLVASARVAYLARRAREYGDDAGAVKVDMKSVYERKRAMVERFRGNGQKTLEKTPNLELIFGEARLKDAKRDGGELKAGRTREIEGRRSARRTGRRPACGTRDWKGIEEDLGKPFAPCSRPRSEFRPPQPRRRRRRDRQFGLHQGESEARDQRPGDLRDRRRQRRPGLHAYLVRRFPHPARELGERRQRDHRRATGAQLRVHRSTARDGRTERDR